MSKRVVIALGSPRRGKNSSRMAALYFAKFLDHDYELINLERLKLPASPDEPCSLELETVIGKLRAADAVVWVSPAARMRSKISAANGSQ